MDTQAQSLGMVHVQTPFRISFFGGGSDLPEHFNRYGGAVLGTTLNRYSYVTVNSLVRLLSKRIKLSYSKLELADNPEEIEHSIVRYVLTDYKKLWSNGFLDIHSFADLPSNSGIGSSSAFTVGFIQALYALNGSYRTPQALAREAIEVERVKVGDKGGWQDQIHCAYGGFNRIDFHENSFCVTPLPLRPSLRMLLERSFMLFFLNNQRSSTGVQEETFSSKNLEEKRQDMVNMARQVDEAQKYLYSETDDERIVECFGRLLDEAWWLKHGLSSAISNSMIDDCYARATGAGAYGGKISGAGGGGFMFYIARECKQNAVREALRDCGAQEISAGFSDIGSRVIFSSMA